MAQRLDWVAADGTAAPAGASRCVRPANGVHGHAARTGRAACWMEVAAGSDARRPPLAPAGEGSPYSGRRRGWHGEWRDAVFGACM